MEIPPREWHIIWHKACVFAAKQVSWMFISQHSFRLSIPTKYNTSCHVRSITYTVLDRFFPYLAQIITIMRGCVARNDLWHWPVSPRSFSCDVAYFMDCINLWHKYNPRGEGEGYPNVSRSKSAISSHDDVIKWKHFPRYWLFARGIHRSSVNFPQKRQWRGALMFSLICALTNGWVNNRGAGDLRRRRAHYAVIVMSTQRLAHRHLLRRISCR